MFILCSDLIPTLVQTRFQTLDQTLFRLLSDSLVSDSISVQTVVSIFFRLFSDSLHTLVFDGIGVQTVCEYSFPRRRGIDTVLARVLGPRPPLISSWRLAKVV